MIGSLAIGAVVAGYRIESLLGRGGMSVVYLAEHERLGRKAALKVLAPELAADAGFRERFIYESRRAAELDHPNVIPIYDAGEVEGGEADGVLYIAMRYVAGSDLKTTLEREGRLEPRRTLRLLEQVAAALDAAHDRELIHRDVKPANVLVEGERVYLTDFGVVKHTASRGLTRTGLFVGTVDYAAPEQIEGRLPDPRVDVYALGCVLYECLTARKPFDFDSEVAVMNAHLTAPPPRVTDERPELPAALDDVVQRGLAKSPEERYERCPLLVEAAREALGERERVAPPRAPARPHPKRRVGLIAAAVAVAAAAAAATLVGILSDNRDGGTSAAGVGSLQKLLPASLWRDCRVQGTPRAGAFETAVCRPSGPKESFAPSEWQISAFTTPEAMQTAYEEERIDNGVTANTGKCSAKTWAHIEGSWSHRDGSAGGRHFCVYTGTTYVAHVVWTHGRPGEARHGYILARATRADGDANALWDWWRLWRDRIGTTSD